MSKKISKITQNYPKIINSGKLTRNGSLNKYIFPQQRKDFQSKLHIIGIFLRNNENTIFFWFFSEQHFFFWPTWFFLNNIFFLTNMFFLTSETSFSSEQHNWVLIGRQQCAFRLTGSAVDPITWCTSCSKWLEPPWFLISWIFRTILPIEQGLFLV